MTRLQEFSPAVFGFAICLMVVPLTAQQGPDEFDPQKVIQEVTKDLETVIREMAKLSGDTGDGAGERVVENIDKLLESMGSSQGRVVKNIDDLIKNTKLQNSQSQGSGSSSQNQKNQKNSSSKGQGQQSSRRDRNNADGSKDRPGESGKPDKKEGGKPEEQGQDEPHDGDGQPDGGSEAKEREQGKGNRPPKEPPPVRNEQDPRFGAWGFLPPEMRQKLIENNFRDYFPDYEREISEYLKSVNRKSK